MLNIFNPFSDFINRILFSQKLGFDYIFLNFSNIIFNILKNLKIKGYINKIFLLYSNITFIIVKLKYYNNEPVIKVFKRISKSNLRVYKGFRYFPKLFNGLGLLLVSTNRGIFSDNFCKLIGLGGELICYVF